MKKLLIAVIVLATFAGCKKGENDPFLSFRSRDARVVGEWKVSSYAYDEASVNGNNTTTVKVAYDGSNYSSTNSNANPPVDKGTYAIMFEMLKDGTLKYTQTRTEGNSSATTVQEGNWAWMDSRKNKSIINLSVSGDQINNNYIQGGTYIVDQLKNKEIVLTQAFSNSFESSGAAGTKISFKSNSTLTLTQ